MVRIFVCGDIVNTKAQCGFVGDKLVSEIRKADYAVCNFEGPELEEGQVASCPHQERGTAAYLKEIGFDLMLLANNHITELGADGVRYSIETIKKTGADCLGAGLSWEETYKPLIRDIGGIRFGFINVCEAQMGYYRSVNQKFGYAWMGYDDLFDDVRKLSAETDRVIVFVHAGLEHFPIPIPEIRHFYQKLCDAGASAVVGGHPHCAQGWERYGDAVIIYSLGNFFFPLRKRWPHEANSYSVVMDFKEDGEIVCIPIIHSNNGERVEKENDDVVGIQHLNNLLNIDYNKHADELFDEAFNGLCKRLLLEATCGQDENDGLKTLIRKFLNYTIRRKKFVISTQKERESLLLLLFENETYRSVITEYLRK